MIALFSPGSGKRRAADKLAETSAELKAALLREATYKAAVDSLHEDLADAERELGDCNRELAAQGEQIRALQASVATLTEERNEARGRSNHHFNGWKAADREVKRLRTLLPAVQPVTVISAPAPVELPGSCFNQPDPAPVTPGPRIIADAPEGPVDSEAADVNAETQPVPVLTLQKALGIDQTQQLPTLDDTQMLVTWGVEATAASGRIAKDKVRIALVGREAS